MLPLESLLRHLNLSSGKGNIKSGENTIERRLRSYFNVVLLSPMPLTRVQIHQQVYYYTLILIAVSLPLSIFTTSMFQLLMLANWLVELGYREKWRKVASNRALQVFLLLFGLHVVGLLWSSNMDYAMLDFKIKLPLLAFPIIIATSNPLDSKQVRRILLFFSLGVLAASMASVLRLTGWILGGIEGYRDLSLFISHIRFSLMIVLAILVSVYFLFISRDSLRWVEKAYYAAVLIWFPVFLLLLKSLTGIAITGLLAFFLLLRALFEIRDPVIRFMLLVPMLMIPLFSLLYLNHSIEKYYTFDELVKEDLDTYTSEGSRYKHRITNREVENGHYTWIYVCEEELEQEWNKVSSLSYRDTTSSGQSVRVTLIRFLTSRGLRKDAAGVRQLSEGEIVAIEKGTTNHIFMKRFRLYPRIYEVIWEVDRYKRGYPPNDKSLVQRYLYLQAGWSIARNHLLIGVGNGDVKQEFKNYYNSVDSPLEEEYRVRAHNQFLTFLISFGVPGFLIFLLALVAPLYLAGRQRSFFAAGFLVLLMLSMLSEDTLETATGAGFSAFFYALFVFGPNFPWLRSRHQKANSQSSSKADD